MRKARIIADGAGYYHCMSRIIEKRYSFESKEKGVTSSGKALKSGFSKEKVEEVLHNGGKLPMHILRHPTISPLDIYHLN